MTNRLTQGGWVTNGLIQVAGGLTWGDEGLIG